MNQILGWISVLGLVAFTVAFVFIGVAVVAKLRGH